MNTVHSEELGVTLNGNIITRHGIPAHGLAVLALRYDQMAVYHVGANSFDVSSVLDSEDLKRYAGLIHRQKSENKLNKKLDTRSGKPDNDPTPPTGGTPGAARKTFYDHIKAIAA